MISVLGFDVGARRIGVAVGNSLTGSARAVAVIEVGEAGIDWSKVEALVREWKPDRLVIGEPLTIDGEAQPATHFARRFATEAAERTQLPIAMVDERYSSLEADRRFAERRKAGQARRRDAAALDAVAAEIIVERFLQGLH
jgi:putative Holliday junction resolvase